MTADAETLGAALTEVVQERRVPGAGFVAFGLYRPTVLAVAGRRRASKPDPVERDDRWHIGSVSKAMTATAMLRQAERGAFDLDESVLDGLSGTPWASVAPSDPFARATIRDLLAHRAGMQRNPTYRLFARYVLLGHGLERTNDRAIRASLTSDLGTHGDYRYSNSGYGIAGLIAAHRTGQSWQDSLLAEVARPVGIDSLGFGRPEWFGPAPWGHWPKPLTGGFMDVRIGKRGLDLELMRPAGDVHVSLDGLAQHGMFHLAQLAALDGGGANPGVLSEESMARQYSPVGGPMDPFRGGQYALGWHIEASAPDFGGGRLVWHSGSDLHSFTLIGLLPDAGVGFALSMNALLKKWHDDTSLVWEPASALLGLAEPSVFR